jgi:hypothetical protein
MNPDPPEAARVQDPEAALPVLIQTRILPEIEVMDDHFDGTAKD